MSKDDGRETIAALRVRQWLQEWDEVVFDHDAHRSRPKPYCFQFSMPAAKLKRLTGVYQRRAVSGIPRSEELSTQRLHDRERSKEIADFVRYGFPWSGLTERQRKDQPDDLKNPGWLPTAVLINILQPDSEREGRTVHPDDLVAVNHDNGPTAQIDVPQVSSSWTPTDDGLHPFEVIDGQHRLWAFEHEGFTDEFELPVIAFEGLDRAWQAYLFWTINITPKRINASLAYDLYPLLRAQEWLERFAGPFVYRETRAQELVEALWAHPLSPWKDRINMLGERGQPGVRQAAWVRSLTATFVRSYEGARVKIGGLFGGRPGEHAPAIPWSRPQQAAFLIQGWRELYDAIEDHAPSWAETLLNQPDAEAPAFFAPNSLLNTDQGVRAVLGVLNDLTVLADSELKLGDWETHELTQAEEYQDVTAALETLQEHQPLSGHLRQLGEDLATFDWRTSNAPGLRPHELQLRLTFRGSSGYNQLKHALLDHLAAGSDVLAGLAGEARLILT